MYQALSIYFLLPILLVSYAAAVHVAAPRLIKRFRARKVRHISTSPPTPHASSYLLIQEFFARAIASWQ
jgi:hypothetical protein